MFRIATVWMTLFLLWMFTVTSLASVRELANDSWQPGDSANYQAGFVSGEIMASRFSVSAAEYPFELLAIRVLVDDGASSGTDSGSFMVHIWEDSGGEIPGDPLLGPFNVILTEGAINEIDLTGFALPPVTSGAVRVGLEFLQDPPPSFFSDDDGFITQHANSIFETNFGWKYAEFFGVTGDWILRLVVDTTDPSPTATSTGTLATYTPLPTYTPRPTATPYPTQTPLPTYTPAPTYTPLSSATPGPTCTPPPTCTTCPTQNPAESLTVTLWMPSHHFKPGSPFLLNALIENSGSSVQDARFLTVLILAGRTWFFPSWNQTVDSKIMEFPSGETIISVLPEFLWPDGAGNMEDVFFITCITDQDYQQLLAAPDIWVWSFSE